VVQCRDRYRASQRWRCGRPAEEARRAVRA
jgi:hypothetical protein